MYDNKKNKKFFKTLIVLFVLFFTGVIQLSQIALITKAYANAPADENFESRSYSANTTNSLVVGSLTFTTDGATNPSFDKLVIAHHSTASEGGSQDATYFTGNVIVNDYWAFYPPTMFQFVSTDQNNKFRMDSVYILATMLTSGGSSVIDIKGYSGGSGGTLKASATGLNLAVSGTYGTITYSRTIDISTEKGGLLTFGSDWTRIDTIVISDYAGDGSQNLELALDSFNFSEQYTAPNIIALASQPVGAWNDGYLNASDVASDRALRLDLSASGAISGDVVYVYSDGAQIGTKTLDATDIANGYVEVSILTATLSGLSGGSHSLTTKLNTSSDSPAVSVNVEKTVPNLVGATRTDDTHITVTLSENCTNIAKANDGGFTVAETGTGTPYAVSAIAQGVDASHVVLTVANLGISAKEGVTVKYTAGGNGTVQDTAGNAMATEGTGVNVAAWDTTSPTITAGTLAATNAYLDVTFSEGVYGASDGATALTAAKLALTFTQNGGTATNAAISSVKQNDNTVEGSASALAGGETTVRVFLTVMGTPSGVETIEVKPADATSIYDKAGNAVSALQTTGVKTLAPFSNANLSGLTLNSGSLNPAFAANTTAYTVSVASSVINISITPTAVNSNATISVNGIVLTSGQTSQAISLNVGDNTITIVVTAQDTSTKTYTITVTRASSNNASLSGLSLNSGILTPAFTSDITQYTATVANSVYSLTVTASVYENNATLLINNMSVASGQSSPPINLVVGGNIIGIDVTAPDGVTTKAYTVTVTREAPTSTNAFLSSLTLSDCMISPAFSSDTTSYTASIDNSISSLTVTAAVYESHATLEINGITAISGQTSPPINLNVGPNAINILVTAQDGIICKNYTVVVTRAAPISTNAGLSALVLSNGTLDPDFLSSVTYYTASVANSVTSFTVTPTSADSNASVTVNGTEVTSGQPSQAISLNVGDNTVTIVVTAQDTVTVKTYTITITRAASGSGNNSNSGSPKDPEKTEIIVDGNTEATAKTTTTNEGDKTVTTVTIKNNIEKQISTGSTIVIPVNNNADIVVGQLSGQLVKTMETKDAVLVIKTNNVTYTLPASQINIDSVSEQLGQEVKLKDITVNVTIAEPPADTIRIVEDTANKNTYQVVVKPVDFEITCTSGDKTVNVSRFNGYVERMIAIPDGIDPYKITTGIVLNKDGTFSHVPTTIVMVNGKYYAKISSLTNSTYSVIWNPKNFKDAENHWAKDTINDMGSRLVIKGVDADNFAPDRAITRAEFAAIIIGALGITESGKTNKFSDVKESEWFYGTVSTVYEYGIISGYEDGSFKPDKVITREEAMAIIARAMKLAGIDTNITDTDAQLLFSKFKDANGVGDWAKKASAICIKNDIVAGSDGMLTPKDNITRAQTASIVRRMLKKANLI